MSLHTYAVSTEREPLGVLDAWMWARQPKDATGQLAARPGHKARLVRHCKVEALQLASLARIERALALFMVVSWRIARLVRLGRTCPDLPASLMFEPDEVAAAYTLNKLSRPKAEPRLNEVIRLVARLGGFLARKGDGEPGVKTLWIGLQRVMDFAAGVRFMREDSAATTCV